MPIKTQQTELNKVNSRYLSSSHLMDVTWTSTYQRDAGTQFLLKTQKVPNYNWSYKRQHRKMVHTEPSAIAPR